MAHRFAVHSLRMKLFYLCLLPASVLYRSSFKPSPITLGVEFDLIPCSFSFPTNPWMPVQNGGKLIIILILCSPETRQWSFYLSFFSPCPPKCEGNGFICKLCFRVERQVTIRWTPFSFKKWAAVMYWKIQLKQHSAERVFPELIMTWAGYASEW